ncbi:MAG: YdeI/OmpD-associated family protein [Candidatus Woesearchaeota archaeon]|nr:YdeI/OmpD-associated family protein [Candidatus Woesearchaeota archaeon]
MPNQPSQLNFHPSTRKDWRNWLKKNHTTETKVYLIKYKKHTGKPTVTNKEALEEAICFGWIDTTVKRLDDERYQQCFVRRNSNSRWSRNTQRYAREMIEQRKMTKAGLAAYKHGLTKPTIDHNLPRNPNTPADLTASLQKNKKAEEFFSRIAPSYRRTLIYFVERAKRPETKTKRISIIVAKCADGKKLW